MSLSMEFDIEVCRYRSLSELLVSIAALVSLAVVTSLAVVSAFAFESLARKESSSVGNLSWLSFIF